ncbi:MAG: serine/threonine protein kinase [Archangiaceae bacterium]|nr:serine/threonine protein kinase [Archangiaceae bacterium]
MSNRPELGPCLTDAAIAAHLAGTTSEAEAGALLEHLERCGRCRQRAVAALGTSQFSEQSAAPHPASEVLARGAVLGKYVVLDPLGQGRMGEVYSALDRELDRVVALKLLRDRARDATLSEARALARLSHPNVIACYDVAEAEGLTFLVMELSRGQTLRSWARTSRRPTEVLGVAIDAARGLAAAHAAGLVHRDFKPDNVLVGDDGRVRVTDFGLARAATDEAAASGAPRQLAGTPSYMAPEQLSGAPADARSDQFSFCATVWECLFGARPFAGDSIAALLAAIERPLDAPARTAPRWLWRALARGLSADPARRWPSMEALVAALERGRAAPTRRLLAAGALLAMGVAVAVPAYARTAARREAALCERAASWEGVWGAEQHQRVHRAFTDSKLPFAEQAWDQASRALDSYAQEWSDARLQQCLAPTGDLDARCLRQRREELRSLVDELSHPSALAVERAASLPLGLTPLVRCALGRGQLAPGPAQPELEDAVAQARAAHQAGRLEAADALVGRVLTSSAATAPLRAEARLLAGRIALELHPGPAVEGLLFTAATEAEAAGAPQLATEAWLALTREASSKNVDQTQPGRWLKLAETSLGRAGDVPDLRSTLLSLRGDVAAREGRFDDALAAHREAIELLRTRFGPEDPRLIFAEQLMGSTLGRQGRCADAEPLLRHALKLREATLGPLHPRSADVMQVLGLCLTRRGHSSEAIPLLQRGLEVLEKSRGADHPSLAGPLLNLGGALVAAGHREEALAVAERSLALRERTLDPKDPRLALARMNVGVALLELDRWAAALELLQRALPPLTGSGTSEEALVRMNLGRALGGLRRYPEALEQLQAARKLMAAARPGSEVIAVVNEAYLLERQARVAPARALLEQALAMKSFDELEGADRANALLAVSRLRVKGGAKAEAVAPQLQAARALYEGNEGPARERGLRQVEAVEREAGSRR